MIAIGADGATALATDERHVVAIPADGQPALSTCFLCLFRRELVGLTQ